MAKLILVRHGQSVWNYKNVFTGWVDVPLTAEGITEATNAGKEIAAIKFDMIYTSVQVRALQTAMIAMAYNQHDNTPVVLHTEGKMAEWSKIYNPDMQAQMIPVIRDWHLNERYYGELQGKNKAETAEQYGDQQVHIWRRSYDTPPPNGECLQDTAARTIPFFKDNILPKLRDGQNILISAHGNSLRSIVMYLDELSSDEVVQLEIPTGKPIYYQWDDGQLRKLS